MRRGYHQRFREMLGPAALQRASDLSDAEIFAPGRSRLRPFELEVAQAIVGGLVVEAAPAVLELNVGADSVIPESLGASRRVGVGPSFGALQRNRWLDERITRDLSITHELPLADGSFDVVVSAFTVPYLQKAERVFAEAGRVLRPGGVLIVLFHDEADPELALPYWQQASSRERTILVEDYLGQSDHFERGRFFSHPVPPGVEATGVHVVYADKRGGDPVAHRPAPQVLLPVRYSTEEVEARSQRVSRSLECPHCGEAFSAVPVQQTAWSHWGSDQVFACLNDSCPYHLRSAGVLSAQGVHDRGYRVAYLPGASKVMALAAPRRRR